MTTVNEWTGRLVQALVTVALDSVSNGRQLPRLSTWPSLPNDRYPSRDQRMNETVGLCAVLSELDPFSAIYFPHLCRKGGNGMVWVMKPAKSC